MSSSQRVVYAVAFGGWLMLSGRDVRADIAASRLHLSYEVPRGCPSREEFLAALQFRIRTSWIDGSDTRSFDVRVAHHADRGFSGTLEIRQPERASRVREIQGDSCKAVTTSLAVFLAIALDPASEPAPPPAGDSSIDATSDQPPVVVDAPAASPPRSRSTSTVSRPAAPIPPRRGRAVWIWSAGYAVSYLHAPEPSWGGRVHAELARADPRERFGPALRLSWGWSDFSTTPPLAGEARFRFKSARAEACARFGLAPFVARACAGADVGTLSAIVPNVPRFTHATTSWVATTGILGLAWSIAPSLALELSGGLLVPFQRPTFALGEPARFVYRAPGAVFEGSAGLGVVARFR